MLEAKRRDIELAVSLADALDVTGSEPLLSVVMSNLIDNAIQYSPKRTRVTVETHRADAAIRIDVVDEGSGIPDALRERVFEPFSACRKKREADSASPSQGRSSGHMAERLRSRRHRRDGERGFT